ncbi:unnamed protein product [Callosobruchus maculatus]|uniref:Uncharacterized protein n=1 Tax=Callosobruchus maculatus TaxID=64391 RepID=A0A653D2P2_CALMS|nr:unnamed protein product [Callosobruchus maculatus]
MDMHSVTTKDVYALLSTIAPQIATIQSDIVAIRNDLQNFKSDIDSINVKVTKLEIENKKLRSKLQTLESKTKKYSLIIYGLPGTEESTEKEVIDLVSNKLKISFEQKDLRDCFRFGKTIEGKHRPTSIELSTYSIKQSILTQARKLPKGSGIFISPEYTTEEYIKRKVLHSNLIAARKKNNSAYIKGGILYVNGDKLTYEDLLEQEEVDEEVEDEADKDLEEANENKPPCNPQEKVHIFNQEKKCNIHQAEIGTISASPGASTGSGAISKQQPKSGPTTRNRLNSLKKTQKNST